MRRPQPIEISQETTSAVELQEPRSTLALNGELDGKGYLSPATMDELRREQTGETKVNYSLGYHLRNGMFGHDSAYGTDLSVSPQMDWWPSS